MKATKHVKSFILLMLWLPVSAGFSGAQTQEPARNRLSLEAFGPGLLYSLSYERDLGRRIGIRWGASGAPFDGFTYVLSFGMLTLSVGGPVHSLYAGLGAGVGWFKDLNILDDADGLEVSGVFSVGYQFQPRPRGVFFRLTYTPFFSAHVIEPLWGGLTVGWAFSE